MSDSHIHLLHLLHHPLFLLLLRFFKPPSILGLCEHGSRPRQINRRDSLADILPGHQLRLAVLHTEGVVGWAVEVIPLNIDIAVLNRPLAGSSGEAAVACRAVIAVLRDANLAVPHLVPGALLRLASEQSPEVLRGELLLVLEAVGPLGPEEKPAVDHLGLDAARDVLLEPVDVAHLVDADAGLEHLLEVELVLPAELVVAQACVLEGELHVLAAEEEVLPPVEEAAAGCVAAIITVSLGSLAVAADCGEGTIRKMHLVDLDAVVADPAVDAVLGQVGQVVDPLNVGEAGGLRGLDDVPHGAAGLGEHDLGVEGQKVDDAAQRRDVELDEHVAVWTLEGLVKVLLLLLELALGGWSPDEVGALLAGLVEAAAAVLPVHLGDGVAGGQGHLAGKLLNVVHHIVIDVKCGCE